MANVTYEYSIADDFPGGAINPSKLQAAIQASAISIAIDAITTHDDVCQIIFKAELPSADKTILDGDTTGPAGGLIAAHDNTPSVDPALPVTIADIQDVRVSAIPAEVGDRAWLFSTDFCDKTTWYGESVAGSANLTGDGVETEFNLGHEFVIDVTHGKISDEDKILTSLGGSYVPVVTVDGVAKAEREFGEADDGDYEIDYAAGTITFFEAPADGDAIVVQYWYSPADAGSVLTHTPPAGKVLKLIQVEAQFSRDITMTNEINAGVRFTHPIAGKIMVPSSYARYKRTRDLHNWARGAFPVIPAFGGSPRGNSQDVVVMRFDYLSPIALKSSLGMDIQFWLAKHRPFTGEFATFTFYGVYEDE